MRSLLGGWSPAVVSLLVAVELLACPRLAASQAKDSTTGPAPVARQASPTTQPPTTGCQPRPVGGERRGRARPPRDRPSPIRTARALRRSLCGRDDRVRCRPRERRRARESFFDELGATRDGHRRCACRRADQISVALRRAAARTLALPSWRTRSRPPCSRGDTRPPLHYWIDSAMVIRRCSPSSTRIPSGRWISFSPGTAPRHWPR